MKSEIICLFFITTIINLCYSQSKPNIIIFMADDLGWNDVSFHGMDNIPTPNIDALAYYGISLNRHYTPPMCTPSRASLLTGKYPIHTGLQEFVIMNDQPYGLGLDEKLLPQYLKEAGYKTHLIGKWHLGMFRKSYTPIYRGFDSFHGYLGGFINYYDHSLAMLIHPLWPAGYDMRQNETLDYSSRGVYATDLFTDSAIQTITNHNTDSPLFLMVNHLAPHVGSSFKPHEAPEDEIAKFNYIPNLERRKLAAMISIMDQSIGKVMKALKKKKLLDNSVILFYSDNGAPTRGILSNQGSNYPLKGMKDSPWEGALRVPAAIWSPLLKSRERVSNQLIHNSDWLPTFVHLAGINLNTTSLDGHNMWDALSKNKQSPRTEIVHNIADDYTSYMKDDYKYVIGTRFLGFFDGWLGDSVNDKITYNPYSSNYFDLVRNSDTGNILEKYSLTGLPISDLKINEIRKGSTIKCTKKKISCYPVFLPCIFNVIRDPCEHENLYWKRPEKLIELENSLVKIKESVIPSRTKPTDWLANPEMFNNTWTWWHTELFQLY